MLEKKGINLAEDGLGDYLESWRQTMLKLIEENSLKEKRIKELEKKLEEGLQWIDWYHQNKSWLKGVGIVVVMLWAIKEEIRK